jgi:hypothetical protein
MRIRVKRPVLSGRVRLAAGDTSWGGRQVDLLAVPDSRHTLEALEDAAALLAVALHRAIKRAHVSESPAT